MEYNINVTQDDITDRNVSTVANQVIKLNDRSNGNSLRVMSEEDWTFWKTNGYIVIKNAVPQEQTRRLAKLIWEFEELDPADQSTWYPEKRTELKKKELSFNAGMVELYNHQFLWDNRQYPRVYDAFVDVWGREDLWVTIDRVNFNLPPEPGFEFKGFMHWDYDPDNDPEVVQGVLSLNDQTDENVGGFQCIPEIFKNYTAWRNEQPEKFEWYRANVSEFTPVKVLLGEGDLLIFSSRLCHGIRQNISTDKVRMAQYISMMPAQEYNESLRNWRVSSWRERLAPEGYSLHGDPREWEKTKYQRAELSELGQKLLGSASWSITKEPIK